MRRKGLDDGIVVRILSLQRFYESRKRLLTFCPPASPSMPGLPKNHIVVGSPESSGSTMIIIRSCDNTPVDAENEFGVDGLPIRNRGEPAIGANG